MRKVSLSVAVMTCLTVVAFAQSNRAPVQGGGPQRRATVGERTADLPAANRVFKPRVTLQEALRIAEDHIEKEKINIAPYFLLEARMIQHGGEKDKREPRWFFLWVNENGAIGDRVEITVSMEGKAARHPSM